jgi:hypothetical protein
MDNTKNSSVIDTLEKLDLRPVTVSNIDWSSGQYSLSSHGIDAITLDSTQNMFSSGTAPMGGITISGANAGPVWTTSTGPHTIGSISPNPMIVNSAGTVSLKGDNADININGKSLMKTLEALEQRLNWLQPNTELEDEWNDLKELGDRYRELEQRCKDKATVWEKLKAMPPPEID